MNKFRITQGVNTCDGSEMFYVYSWDAEYDRWAYRSGFGKEADARAHVERIKNPVPEVVIAEIEA